MTSPHVELLVGDLDLNTVQAAGRVGALPEVMEGALNSFRMLVVNEAKSKIPTGRITGATVLELIDAAASLRMGRLSAILGPVAGTSYRGFFSKERAGDAPDVMVVSLADQHVERIGKYYHETSREAVLHGFNTLVNKKVPPRLAAEQAIEAYGMTTRQMNGLTSLDTTQKVASGQTIDHGARRREYLGRSLRSRAKTIAAQESHSMEVQAQQLAWTWLQSEGRLTDEAQKVWLTANDERTCKVCGPMHGVRVAVQEKFELPNGHKVWVPGVHPNCRCEVRVTDLGKVRVAKRDPFQESDVRRDSGGKFTYKPGSQATATMARPKKDMGAAQKKAAAMYRMTEGGKTDLNSLAESLAEVVFIAVEHGDVETAERYNHILQGVIAQNTRTKSPPMVAPAVPTTVTAPAEPEKEAPRKFNIGSAYFSVSTPTTAPARLEFAAPTTREVAPATEANIDTAFNLEPYKSLKPKMSTKVYVRDLDKPIYKIVEGRPGQESFADTPFTNYEDALGSVRAAKEKVVEDALEKHTDWDGNVYFYGDRFEMSREQARKALTALAESNYDYDENRARTSIKEKMFEVRSTIPVDNDAEYDFDRMGRQYNKTYTGHGGDRYQVEDLSAEEIGEELGYSAEDLKISLVEIQQVHDEKGHRGDTTPFLVGGEAGATEGFLHLTGEYEPGLKRGVDTPDGDVIDIITYEPFDPKVEETWD